MVVGGPLPLLAVLLACVSPPPLVVVRRQWRWVPPYPSWLRVLWCWWGLGLRFSWLWVLGGRGSPRYSWLWAPGAVPRLSWLGARWCWWWVAPRHSWLRVLGAVPRHSWLGSSGVGGQWAFATPG